jgi:hypothetical protein
MDNKQLIYQYIKLYFPHIIGSETLLKMVLQDYTRYIDDHIITYFCNNRDNNEIKNISKNGAESIIRQTCKDILENDFLK